MSTIEKICSTCKHYPSDEHCKGCILNLMNSSGNTNWSLKVFEPKEPFINKPCVSEQACHEDKMKVLEKIIEKLKEKSYSESEYGVNEFDASKVIQLSDAIEIIDGHMKESEDI